MTKGRKAEQADVRIRRGAFLDRVRAAEARALATGALQPIATRSRVLERGGLRVLVRILTHAERKALARKEQDVGQAPEDPFLPYDPELLVQGLGTHHVALLNKFQVLEHHVLIVTRDFEHQESPLTRADFAALHEVMRTAGGLGFYNAGEVAGASQRHKHLQWVPTPLDPACSRAVPIDAMIPEGPTPGHRMRVRGFRFVHELQAVPGSIWTEKTGPTELLDRYRRMLDRVGLKPQTRGRLPPYNLLLSQRWMLLVPRRRECWNGVSINALGFAGAFLVRKEEEFRQLAAVGPLEALRHVAVVKAV